ncbi:hypothetical protein QBC35DRAFT_208767 [Podospora australis]|uniref:HTH APSES-type domain-containing protein n=1 Tax=Podospora australis TaxID=1536484 RepID=A0AAN6WVY6_9PEZI|nr:hypothetical protein QBC35DRAFT_208767 [Podospora australis]
MASTRKLPERHNPYLTDDVPSHNELISRRRLGRTRLAPKTGEPDGHDPSATAFDYAHLRAPLPKGIVSPIWGSNKSSPSNYFLMRRSQDGYISATGMFKASFPYAKLEEEEAERKYIQSLVTTSRDETAGNVWIPPESALALAEEYKMVPWIRALLDPSEVLPNPGAEEISHPPKFTSLLQPTLAPPTPVSTRTTRSRRSASPTKSVVSKRAIASPRKRRVASSQSSVTNEPTPSLADSQAPTLVNGDSQNFLPAPTATVAKVEDTDGEIKIESLEKETPVVLEPAEEEPKIKVHVDQDIKLEGGEEVKHTHVEVEVPVFGGKLPSSEDAAKMIAEAKAMVEAATKTVEDETPSSSSKPKRKAEDIADGEDEERTEGEASAPQAKKVKTQEEVRKQTIRKRAYLGLGATLAVGAVSALFPVIAPYIANAL